MTTSTQSLLNQPAPDLVLQAGDGRFYNIRTGATGATADEANAAAPAGRARVVYFYPKDDTPGCTTEACDFTAEIDVFSAEGADVFGVSPDSVASHARFANKHSLRVQLLADTEQIAASAFGVWREKSMYGRVYFGIVRSTFLIDRHGTVRQVWEDVKVRRKSGASEVRHVDEVRAALQQLA